MAVISELRFPISEAMLTAYNTPENADLFDAVNSQLVLYVHPGDYRPVWTAIGQGGIIDGFGATVVQVTKWRYGFDVQTIEGRTAPLAILRTLAKNAAATLGQYTPIQVLDFVRPEPSDELSTGYTVRHMRLENLQPTGAMRAELIAASSRYSQGFQFRMVEVNLRDRY